MMHHTTELSSRQQNRGWPPASDLILAGVVTVVACLLGPLPMIGATTWPWYESQRAIALLLSSVTLTAPLALRRTRPLLMLLIMTVAGVVQCAVSPVPTVALIAVPIASYSVARWIDGRSSRQVLIAGGFGSVLGPMRWVFINRYVGDAVGPITLYTLFFTMCFASVVVPYLIGRRARENDRAEQERALAAVQRYEAELATRKQEARATEARVRNDIARELHDIVAHSLSVIIVQAEGGRAMAAKRPQAATEALETIADTGRDALTEMRRIVGVLRGDPNDAGAEYRPSPGLVDIPTMLDRAGERVQVQVIGNPPTVPPTLGLTAYRVVQEAVTNFLKHAGPQAKAHVTITYPASSDASYIGAQQILLDVVDDGLGAAVHSDGAGNGLRGMAERVNAMGGQLYAHPGANGIGFEVHAILPLSQPAPESGRVSSSENPASLPASPYREEPHRA